MRHTIVAEYLQEQDARPGVTYSTLRQLAIESAQAMLSRGILLMDVSCPACASTAQAIAFTRYDYRYLECSDCGTLYISPRPTTEAMKWYLWDSPVAQFRFSEALHRQSQGYLRELVESRSDWVVSLCHASGLSPTLPVVAIQERYAAIVSGIARRISGAVYAVMPLWVQDKASGIVPVSVMADLNAMGKNQAQTVVAFDVLEHTAEPAILLRDIYDVLAPGGFFALTTRSGSGFDIQALWESLDNVFPLEHINLISVRGMRILLERLGFDVLELSTPGQLDVQVVVRSLNEGVPMPSSRILRHLVLGDGESGQRDLQQFLQRHFLSSHMRVVARKPTKG